MIICGIVVVVIAILMVLFPRFFLKLKTPNANITLRLERLVRIWGMIWMIVGIVVLIVGLI